MAGSSTIDSTKLVDRFIGLADRLRGELNTSFGTRQWHVTAVARRWPSGKVGEGHFVDDEVLIEPDPLIESYAFTNRLEPAGEAEAGSLLVSQVSLTYTEDELGGGEAEPGVEHFFRIEDAQGQGTRTRYFANRVPPYPDRRRLGWLLELEVLKDPPAAIDPAADAGDDAMPVTPGSALAKDLGNLAVNGAVTAQTADYIVPSGKKAIIQRITVALRCATAPTDDGFGDLAALTNGLLLQFLDTDLAVLFDLTTVPIKLNDHWGMISGADVDIDTTLNQVRCTITLPAPIELESAQRFRATVQDNLASLEEFRIQLRGYTQND